MPPANGPLGRDMTDHKALVLRCIDEILREGDFSSAGQFMPQRAVSRQPPSEKQISVSAIAIFRIANGKVAEEWLSNDRQLPKVLASARLSATGG
jgi:hypothetical protein